MTSAAHVPALYFFCVLVNYGCVGSMYAIFPVACQNVFGTEFGPQIYVWVLLGGFVTSLLNLLVSLVILPATSTEAIFYSGAVTQIITLVLIWSYEEKLDTKNLAKFNALKMPDTQMDEDQPKKSVEV